MKIVRRLELPKELKDKLKDKYNKSSKKEVKYKTKCLKCDICETHEYKRVLRTGKEFSFKYCNGNANFVSLCDWWPHGSVGYAKNSKYGFFHTLFKNDDNMVIDHINGNALNNQLNNLRECSQLKNMRNKHYKRKKLKSASYYRLHYQRTHNI